MIFGTIITKQLCSLPLDLVVRDQKVQHNLQQSMNHYKLMLVHVDKQKDLSWRLVSSLIFSMKRMMLKFLQVKQNKTQSLTVNFLMSSKIM